MAWKETSAKEARTQTTMSGLERFLRRRRFLTCPSLQVPLLFATFGHLLIVSGALAAALFGPSIIALLSSDTASDRAVAAANQILFLHFRFWPALALALLLVALDSIRISHKIAGPLYRFDKALERVRQGRVPEPIRLRGNDFLQNDCKRINTVLELARSYLGEVREVRQGLTRSIEEARNSRPGLSSEELESRLGDLADRAERLVDLSRRFDLDERGPES